MNTDEKGSPVQVKPAKGYVHINAAGAAVCILTISLLFLFREHRVLCGVLLRGAFSLLIIYNAIYAIATEKPSFLVRSGQGKRRRVMGIILLVVGLFAFATALMGYGINSYPLLDWGTVFTK